MENTSINRTAVITGASSGVGKAAAKALAAMGWNIIAQGRDAGRTASAEAEIRSVAPPGTTVDMIRADLSLLSEAARMADEVAALTPRVDALLNNAGGVRAERVVTAEGNEATFAGNHLGHFVLTTRLLPQLRVAVMARGPGAARIIATSSDGHAYCPGFNWDDPQLLANWSTGGAYCLAKLANVLFTRDLARRFGPQGIVSHVLHPGTVDSNFVNHADTKMREHIIALDMISPEAAAAPLVWLASSDEAGTSNGLYWERGQPVAPSPAALDDTAAEKLWAESLRLVELASLP